jgi:exopolysaccharide production protein ExoQ
MTDAYFVCVYALSTGAFVSLFVDFGNTAEYGNGSPLFKFVWGLVAVITVLRLIARRHEIATVCRANKPLISIVVIALTSIVWSIDKSATLHLGATLAFTTLFALDLSTTYSIKRQLELLCQALILLLVLSVIAEVFLPGVVPVREAEEGAWHGVFAFKNNFGRVICLAVVACLALLDRSLYLKWLVLVSGITLSVLSKSVGSVGYMILLVGSILLWPLLKWQPKPRAFALAVLSITALLTIYYVSQNFTQILAMTDRDPHMTGRVDLWQLAISDIRAKPLLGYGYGAFWGYDSQPARRIREAVNWDEAPHAHNGYIDFALSLGALGIVSYFLAYFIVAKDAFSFFMSGTEGYRKWPLSYLLFVLLYQCTESGIVGGNNILWILFASLAFSLSLTKERLVLETAPTMTTTTVMTANPHPM